MKNWYKSRTIHIAIAMGITGVITAIETEYKLPGILIAIKSLIDMWLRFDTKSALK